MGLQDIYRKSLHRAKLGFEKTGQGGLYSTINENGYKRVYLIHIRKTGGTSLNHMFLSLSGGDPKSLYAELASQHPHRIKNNGLVFVGWDTNAINSGNYFYAFSHAPIHKLRIPKKTFTLSCFRDPIARVVSHYNMLADFSANRVQHPCMAIEGEWLGASFSDFLERIPREHLQNQLFMFSRTFDINEAISRVKNLSTWFFGDKFEEGVARLNKKTGLALQSIHIRKSNRHQPMSNDETNKLKHMLSEELSFIEEVTVHGSV